MLTLPPLSLYVHLPWCVRKCPYCDFNSHEAGSPLPETAYVEALIRDLDRALLGLSRRTVHSIFLGGGTPSLFSAGAVHGLLSAVAERLPLAAGLEVSMEANPGTAEAGRFAGYREAGVNRLSIGVQSLDDEKLRALGRIHDAAEARNAVEAACCAGFDNINLDLMYGLPGQDPEQALDDLTGAIRLRPSHISWYQLTLEPNTVFHSRPPAGLPDDDAAWVMQQSGQRWLAAAGYTQYEVSAYALAGREARHNLNYWQFGDYLGLGAGAHSKLTDVAGNRVLRQARHRLPARYMELSNTDTGAVAAEQVLQEEDLVIEFMMNALRLNSGFSIDRFAARTGLPFERVEKQVGEGVQRGLLSMHGDVVCTTGHGQQYLNILLELF